MENKTNILDSLLERTEDYVKTSIELFKLRMFDKLSESLSSVTFRLILMTAVLFFLILISVGVSFWLGEILGRVYYGFFITASFYGILSICLYVFMRKWVLRVFGNIFIKMFSR